MYSGVDAEMANRQWNSSRARDRASKSCTWMKSKYTMTSELYSNTYHVDSLVNIVVVFHVSYHSHGSDAHTVTGLTSFAI